MANFLNQDTTIIGLPAGCVGHDIHFTDYREGNIIILGKCSNHHICLRFRSSWFQYIPDCMSGKESLQHKSTRRRCKILGRWTTVVSPKTWAGSATHMWTCCLRQTWSHGSLTIKHYRVQVGNHHRGCRSLVHDLALAQQLLFLEQINQWLGVLGISYGMKMISLTDHRILRTCINDLGRFQRR